MRKIFIINGGQKLGPSGEDSPKQLRGYSGFF